MRPFLARQRAINNRLTEKVLSLDERLLELAGTLQNQQEARFAETLAGLRRLERQQAESRAQLQTTPDALRRSQSKSGEYK
jgi:hypothetical protein